MENENLDLDIKPAGNKDLWLFLIIIDIIFLCVFGFFLYKHFSTRLFEAPAAAAPVEQTEVVEVPEISETDVVAGPEAIVVESVAAAPVSNTKPEVKPAPAKEPEVKPAEQTQPAAAQEKKESIVIKVNPKSKYRRVTFRWFGEGDKVSVVSGFTMAKPKPLKKRGDYWETTLSIAPGTYKFLYVVDGKNRLDPYSEEKDGRSLLVIE